MPLQSNNPFFAAATAEAGQSSRQSTPHANGSNNPFNNLVSSPECLSNGAAPPGGTSPAFTAIRNTDSRPPSPVPEYSRHVPKEHRVVGREIVESMPASSHASADTKDQPPSYFAHMLETPTKPELGFDIRDPSRRGETRFSEMFGGGVASNNMYDARGRSTFEMREHAERERRALERSNRRRERIHRSTGIWACLRLCWPKGTKTQGNKKTFWIISAILASLVVIVIGTIAGVLGRRNQPVTDPVASRAVARMHTVEGFPPLSTGTSVVSPASGALKRTVCVKPPQLWSCDMPRPANDSIPEFLFEISHRETDPLRDASESLWVAHPEAPDANNYKAVADFDSVQIPGKRSPFLLSLKNKPLDYAEIESTPTQVTTSRIVRRSLEEMRTYERLILGDALTKRQTIADPTRNPPNMIPRMMRNQPLYLVDAGLPSEHYTAHIYYDKSLFLDSINMRQNTTTIGHGSGAGRGNQEVPGTSPNAKFACVWHNTRFKVQIWTRAQDTRTVIDRSRNRMERDEAFGKGPWIQDQLNAFMPFPVTVTEDRQTGGEEDSRFKTNLACYAITENGKGGGKSIDWATRQSMGELPARDSGDGCICQWENSRERNRGDGP